MSMQDPISDMLTYIRNGYNKKTKKVIIPFSNIKKEISRVLKEEGYIKDYRKIINDKINLVLTLKYYKNKSVIENIKRISKPSLRIYIKKKPLLKIVNNLGINIITTSKGIMSDNLAIKNGIGGEIICYVN